MKKPILSVIVPMYNSKDYIIPCLESVTGYDDIEVIVVDDGSSDNSVDVVSDYFYKHKNMGNFHLYKMPHRGISLTRREGVKRANSSYIAFLDSDDKMYVNECLYLLDEMKKNRVKVGMGRLKAGNGKQVYPSINIKRGERVISFKEERYELSSILTLLTSKIWHKDILEYYDSIGSANEDVECVPFMLVKANKIYTTDKVIYQRVNRKGSVSFTDICDVVTSKSLKNTVYPLLSLKKRFMDANLYEKHKSEVDAICMKQFFERIFNIKYSKSIKERDEVIQIVVSLLNKVVPEYRENIHFLNHFKHMELNDWFCYKVSRKYVLSSKDSNKSIDELLEQYDLIQEKSKS